MNSNKTFYNDSTSAQGVGNAAGIQLRSSGYSLEQQEPQQGFDQMKATTSSQYTDHHQLPQDQPIHQQLTKYPVAHLSTNDRQISHSHAGAPVTTSGSSSLKWKYFVTNDVQLLDSIEDAKRYIQEVANIWKLQHYQNGKKFVVTLMKAIEQHEKAEVAYDYLNTNEHGEDFYILVIIRQNADKTIDVCYSYQSITLASSRGSGISLSERKSVSWLKQTASQNLNAHTLILKSFSESLSNEQSRGGAGAISMSDYDPHLRALQKSSKK
ncbi:unnamed protein product [Rotaria sp. Silwood2]|nr:unnamed protein product [Rotaria sp. Silwood2]CAF2844021.1 unnamed protein product [Rotaria sp. Silwood2]CAF3207380.1 unnamed protein product [Rotaria sp. Silwood2]CAF4132199.1 unnamed protein product [Rotaria sp. Silwood2]CAF4237307.1 unnamed protein product [Rotaria sp. Silwood2]